jgi:hypothetical protein
VNGLAVGPKLGEDTWALVGLLPDDGQWFAQIDEAVSKRTLDAAFDTGEKDLAARVEHVKTQRVGQK